MVTMKYFLIIFIFISFSSFPQDWCTRYEAAKMNCEERLGNYDAGIRIFEELIREEPRSNPRRRCPGQNPTDPPYEYLPYKNLIRCILGECRNNCCSYKEKLVELLRRSENYNEGISDDFRSRINQLEQVCERVCNPPNCANYISPENNSTSSQTNIVLKWYAVQNADSYLVYFGETSNNLSYRGTVTGSSYEIGNLGRGRKYWKIVPRRTCAGNVYEANNCPVWSFEIEECRIPLCPSINSIFPSNGATLNIEGANLVKLRWERSENATSYDIFYGANPRNLDNVLNTSSLSANINVIPGETYYWRISPKNNCGANNNCLVLSFVPEAPRHTQEEVPERIPPERPHRSLECPDLVFPENNETISQRSINLSWLPVPNAQRYDIYYSNSNNLNRPVASTQGTLYNISNLNEGRYFWKIIPKANGYTSPDCSSFSFNVLLRAPNNVNTVRSEESPNNTRSQTISIYDYLHNKEDYPFGLKIEKINIFLDTSYSMKGFCINNSNFREKVRILRNFHKLPSNNNIDINVYYFHNEISGPFPSENLNITYCDRFTGRDTNIFNVINRIISSDENTLSIIASDGVDSILGSGTDQQRVSAALFSWIEKPSSFLAVLGFRSNFNLQNYRSDVIGNYVNYNCERPFYFYIFSKNLKDLETIILELNPEQVLRIVPHSFIPNANKILRVYLGFDKKSISWQNQKEQNAVPPKPPILKNLKRHRPFTLDFLLVQESNYKINFENLISDFKIVKIEKKLNEKEWMEISLEDFPYEILHFSLKDTHFNKNDYEELFKKYNLKFSNYSEIKFEPKKNRNRKRNTYKITIGIFMDIYEYKIKNNGKLPYLIIPKFIDEWSTDNDSTPENCIKTLNLKMQLQSLIFSSAISKKPFSTMQIILKE